MEKSGIILAGGFSSRLGQDKGLVHLAGEPLINHVLNTVTGVTDEKLVIVSSKTQAEKYQKAIGEDAKVFVDKANVHSPLAGALTGFEQACGKYSLLLSCDTPLVSRDVLSLLLELRIDRNAVIPRWPNGYIEPLQAVYCTKPALEATRNALNAGELNLRAMVEEMRSVRYISTIVLEQLDPDLRTFLNVNTPMDLKKAETILRHSKSTRKSKDVRFSF